MPSSSSRTQELERIRPILDQARALRPTYEGDHAIWRALDNFRITDERTRLAYFRLIKSELTREDKEREAQRTVEDKAWRDMDHRNMMADAARAEAHHRHILGEDY
jgi:hypothetical protein